MLAEVAALALLAAVLVAAVVRPRGLPEAVIAVPAAGLAVGLRLVSSHDAAVEVRRLLPVVVFLGAVLVLGEMSEREGLFAAAGDRLAKAAGSGGVGLLGAVFVAAAVVTCVLSLDATVVLLTPVVLTAARRHALPVRPHAFASTHLANSASLLLPVANLTNLLALAVTGVSFLRFAGLMLLPWLVVLAVEYAVHRRTFAADLAVAPVAAHAPPRPMPRLALAVLAITLLGFVVTSLAGLPPAWAAVAGAVVLAGHAVATGRARPVEVGRSSAPAFLLFVLALGVVVRAVSDRGLGHLVARLVPTGDALPVLLAVAAIAALLANLLNNLPATLLLLPVLAPGGTGPVLAALIGVNVGPNLTYSGSLATLLWRRVLADRGVRPGLAEFTRLGLLTVPVAMVGAVLALRLALSL